MKEEKKKSNLLVTLLKPALLVISTVIFIGVKGSRSKNKNK